MVSGRGERRTLREDWSWLVLSRNANIREWMATKRIAKSVPKRAESSTATHLLENQVSGTRAGENGDKMGKTLLVEAIPSKLALVEGTGGKLIARGEFGRVGTPTDNGRTYPEKLMLREIKKLEPDMKRRRVLGELDHPCLTSDDFRVLTESGWKAFREIRIGDRVWSRKDGTAVLSEVTGIVDEPYDGKAYHVYGRSMDATFTPAHRFLMVRRPDRNSSKSEEFVTLAEIVEHRSQYGHHAIPKTAKFFSEGQSKVAVPGVDAKNPKSCKNDVSRPLELDAGLFAAFLGIYMAEGYCSSDSVDNYDVLISQKTPWSKQFIYDEVLSKFPDGLEWREIDGGYALADQRLYAYLKPLGNAYSKHLPEEVKRLDSDSLSELLYWYCIGDGRMVASNASKKALMASEGKTTKESLYEALREGHVPFTRQDVFSVSENLVRDLHECLIRSGGAGSILRVDPEYDYEFAGHTIRAADKVPLYQLHICQSANVWMDPRHLAIDEVHHTGNIYCLNTTHGSFYMERNGYSWWTGNSDGRTSLKRASHVITSLKIKDGIVIGEAEILGTPEGKILKALIDAGVEVGVSSRGFGSTAPGDGNNEAEVVQDDFSLKTYDFVADPAVRSAVPAIYTEDLDDPSIAKMFMDEFPEIAESLKGGEGALTESADDKDAKALRESVVAELSENFERKLKDALVEQREGLERQLREEIGSDPEIGGAKAVLAAIADLVSEYRTDLSDAVVCDAMKAKELEVAEAVEQRDKALSMAKMAAHGLHIERAISGHPMAESIRKLMLNRTFENVKEVQVALDAILEDLPAADDVVSKDEARVREENAELRGKIALLESKVDELEGRVLKASKLAERIDEQRIAEVKEANEKIAEVEDLLEEAQAKAEKAEERIRTIQESSNRRVEEAKLQAYKLEKVAGLPNGRELLGLMENVQDRSVVDELVEKRGVRRMADESLNQMLDRVKKGKTGSRMRLEEEGEERHNRKRINELGQDMDELSVLAGIQPSID